MPFLKIIRFGEQFLFSLYSFLLTWRALNLFELQLAAYFGLIVAIYSITHSIINSLVCTPLLFVNNQRQIPEIYPLQCTVVLGIFLCFSDNNYIVLALLVPVWILRDVLRVFSIYIEDKTTLYINGLTLIFGIATLLYYRYEADTDPKLIIFLSLAPATVNAVAIIFVKTPRIQLIKYIRNNFDYGLKNGLETFLASLVYQIPIMALYHLNQVSFVLMFAMISQVLNFPATIVRITTMLIASRYRLGSENTLLMRTVILIGAGAASVCCFLLVLAYPPKDDWPEISYYLTAFSIFFAYIFVIASKPFEWKYRTMPQTFLRVHHIIFSTAISLILSCLTYIYFGIPPAIVSYLTVNYVAQFLSFNYLASRKNE